MKNIFVLGALFLIMVTNGFSQAPQKKINDTNTPLYLLPPDYPFPYGPAKQEDVIGVLNKIYSYLDAVTPPKLINAKTKKEITDYSKPDPDAVVEPGAFRLISYEWGVTYGAMLLAGEATGDKKFSDYTLRRMKFLADVTPYFRGMWDKDHQQRNPLRPFFEPRALDDAGSMCAAMIKTMRAGLNAELRPVINTYADYISTKEFRLPDGTLARNRPQRNTMWLDDLYMSVPALAQMGKLTGDQKYFNDAVKQVLSFKNRMYVKENDLFMHGWVEEMKVHPPYHWGRANGWAILTMSELLDVLPENHPDRAAILDLFRSHIRGIAHTQSGSGLWHQLLDRNDSYLETSASAIFTYCLAHGINQGWLDPLAYGPAAVLGWNALSTKVNAEGQVEGTCVGTGMGFDPAFYYFRPTHPLAAHGYGPMILAGAEMLKLMKNYQIVINETSVMFYHLGVDWKNLQIK